MYIPGFDGFREIGRGGSSVVYAGRQERLGRDVAIKVLNVDLSDASARRRFERECSVLGTLGDAPGIVAVYSAAFTDDGRGCIVMRLMRESLAATLRREGPLDAARVRDIGIVTAGALSFAHGRGIVHRDVKPANLLVSEFGEVALGDFDIAAVGELTSGRLTPSTVTRDSMSPPHAPPEQLDGRGHSGPAGDVWSLGSTLFTLVEGRLPFGTAASDGGMAGLIERVLHEPMPPLTRGEACPGLETVLARALAKDPRARWPNAAAMAAALTALGGGPSTPTNIMPTATSVAVPAGQAAPAVAPSGDHDHRATLRELATIGVVLLVVVIAVVAALIVALA